MEELLIYELIWRGEVIEHGLLMNEAIDLQREYEVAYRSSVRIQKERG